MRKQPALKKIEEEQSPDNERINNEQLSGTEQTRLEKLNARLNDDFSFRLSETLNFTQWKDILSGVVNGDLEFIEYFDEQLKLIYQLKDKPYILKAHFANINFGRKQGKSVGNSQTPSAVSSSEHLPVLRQQIFLINALHIVVKKRLENDSSLKLADSVLSQMLHVKIVDYFQIFAEIRHWKELDRLSHNLNLFGSTEGKAKAVLKFLVEILEKNNLYQSDGLNSDDTSVLAFMADQLSIPYNALYSDPTNIHPFIKEIPFGLPQDSNDAFGNDERLFAVCATLYNEYQRLIALVSLEGLEQKDSAIETQSEREPESKNTMRQKALTLMLLTFGRLDIPKDIKKERVVEFFHSIMGGNRKNLSDLLANPTMNTNHPKSIKSLCDDLNFVRDQLGKLGLSKNVTVAINEINFLIEDLEQKSEEQ